ncbi:aspartate/glutamate racemase family protein [Pseudomonas alabamensis]|uniref:aspartate/glutamate racemase family protein n=1 Tax=Pseudomonas alabamensis TaxID=3064349 RepID=UPI0011A89CE0
MTSTKRIFLVHATALAIEPITTAFAQLWPEAELCNLLEDSLSRDLRSAGHLTDVLKQRFCDLARYARSAGADAVLFTCSAFGEAIELSRQQLDIPVLKPNEAMIEQALALGSRIAILATFEPSLESISAEFRLAAQTRKLPLQLVTAASADAYQALQTGNVEHHDQWVAQLAGQFADCDVVCFSQFSMTRAAAAARQASGRQVLTTPDSAVLLLRRLLES